MFRIIKAESERGTLRGTVCSRVSNALLESRGSLARKTARSRPVLTINRRNQASLAIHHPESAYLSRICYLVGPPLPIEQCLARDLSLARRRSWLLRIDDKFFFFFTSLKFFYLNAAILKRRSRNSNVTSRYKSLPRENIS